MDASGFSSDDRLGGTGFRPVVLALWHHPYWQQRNDYAIAHQLLERGARYSITVAAALGDEKRVRDLLASNAELANDQEPGGKRPLSAAAERNHVGVVNRLLDAGADPNLDDAPSPLRAVCWDSRQKPRLSRTGRLLSPLSKQPLWNLAKFSATSNAP